MRSPGFAVLLPVLLVAPLALTAGVAAPAGAAESTTAVVEKRVIGTSVEGRDITAWRLGNPRSSKKVLLLAGMHGNETGAVHTLRALRDGRPIDGADIWVVPVVNPDGVARNTRQNARKVDLNRNFSTKWARLGGAVNSGRKAFSEPESRAVRDFVDEIHPTHTISFHQPLNGIDIRDTGNDKWAKRLAANIRLPRKAFDCFSRCHGTYSMWVRKHHPKGAVITVEMTAKPSRKYLTRIVPRAVLRSVNATR
jgi:protein MpaA